MLLLFNNSVEKMAKHMQEITFVSFTKIQLKELVVIKIRQYNNKGYIKDTKYKII